MADLDGDGKTDISTANKDKKTISVFKNTSTIGGGSFAQKVDFTADYAGRIAIGDLDGDGKPDLTVTNYPSATVSVLRNTTTQGVIDARSFAPNVNFAIVHSGSGLAIGDLDGDGQPDLAVVGRSHRVKVFKNTSVPVPVEAISFAEMPDWDIWGSSSDVAIGDLNGDGKPDLATTPWVYVFKNTSPENAQISFNNDNAIYFPGYGIICIGDLDGDGRPDLVTSSSVLFNCGPLISSTITGDTTNPDVPIFTSSPGDAYEWFKNGLPFANTPSITNLGEGSYTVRATVNGCDAYRSNPQTIIITGNISKKTSEFLVYPIPAHDQLFVKGASLQSGNWTVTNI